MITIGSTAKEAVNNVFGFILISAIILVALVTGLMIAFAIRYNRKRHPKPERVKQRLWLEILWTLIPTMLVMVMFYYGVEGFNVLRRVPSNALIVKVTGRMWNWSFDYPNGKHTLNLYVPVNQPIKLELSSVDVIHSFFMPAFRIKEDAVPGRPTYLWFKPQTVGPADIFCAEYCGLRHAFMLSRVIVMTKKNFDTWYTSDKGDIANVEAIQADQMSNKKLIRMSEADLNKLEAVKLLKDNDCLSCHTLGEHTPVDQISLKGLMGKKQKVIKEGKEIEITIDEDYLRRAILNPSIEIVKGYPNMMTPPEKLSEYDLKLMIDFLKEYK